MFLLYRYTEHLLKVNNIVAVKLQILTCMLTIEEMNLILQVAEVIVGIVLPIALACYKH